MNRKEIQEAIKAAKVSKTEAFHKKNTALAALKAGRAEHAAATTEVERLQELLRKFDSGEGRA